MKKFSKLPALQSDRLILRKLNESDNSVIYSIRSNKEIARYLDRPLCHSVDEADQFINKINTGIENGEALYWAVCKKSDQVCIGTICLWNLSEREAKAEIGFELLPDYQNYGYMSEAAKVVINFGFNQMHLKNIDGEVDPGNVRSIQLMKKLGFKLTDPVSGPNVNANIEIYTLHNPDN